MDHQDISLLSPVVNSLITFIIPFESKRSFTKWHLGYCHESFLPNNRGFDYFFGQYNHVTEYYSR